MDQNNRTTMWIIVGVLVFAVVGYFVYQMRKTPEPEVTSFITNFEDCVKAGYPIMESYPRQCTSPEGNNYIEEAGDEEPSTAVATGGCYIGGCSAQLCTDQPDAVSTCEYRAEYACYKSGSCGRQTDGKCGWTETSTLTACLTAGANNAELLK